MPVHFNHTILNVSDPQASAEFVAEILGLDPPYSYEPFTVVQLANDVSLDFIEVEEVHRQHYAFLVSEPEFDVIRARIEARGLTFWADPFRRRPGEVNTDDGGRGLYWEEPSGHLLEMITRHYGSGA